MMASARIGTTRHPRGFLIPTVSLEITGAEGLRFDEFRRFVSWLRKVDDVMKAARNSSWHCPLTVPAFDSEPVIGEDTNEGR